jgi:hypothetical protein
MIDQTSDTKKSPSKVSAGLKSKLQSCCCFWKNGNSKNDGGVVREELSENLLNNN